MDLLCLVCIWVYASLVNKKPCHLLNELFLLDSHFGKERISFKSSITSMDKVQSISEKIMNFLKNNRYSKKLSFHTALCIEEMAGNIIEYGFDKSGKKLIDVSITCKEQKIVIIIRDNCKFFDPTKRISSQKEKDSFENIGIKIVSKIADEMKYIDALSINTLIIELKDMDSFYDYNIK